MKLTDLIKYKNNTKVLHKSLLSSTFSKNDKKEYIKNVNNVEGSAEDNLSKVERAFLIDLEKSVGQYGGIIENYTIFADENYKYFSTVLYPFSNIDSIRDRSHYIVSQSNISRAFMIMGFTINQYSSDIPTSFFEEVNNYCIEIPIDSYYNLSEDKRMYVLDIEKSKEEQYIYIKNILDEFNIKEGETKNLNGYLIPVIQRFDDWGYIVSAKKTNSSYYITGIRNGQPEEYNLNELL